MVEECQEFNNTKRYKTMNKVNLPKFNIYFLDYNIFSGSLKGLGMALIYIKVNLTTMRKMILIRKLE